jgi:hypothetical protein
MIWWRNRDEVIHQRVNDYEEGSRDERKFQEAAAIGEFLLLRWVHRYVGVETASAGEGYCD